MLADKSIGEKEKVISQSGPKQECKQIELPVAQRDNHQVANQEAQQPAQDQREEAHGEAINDLEVRAFEEVKQPAAEEDQAAQVIN